MNDTMSISELLMANGFGDAKVGTEELYKHTIFNLSTGYVVGSMSAHEACEFLDSLVAA